MSNKELERIEAWYRDAEALLVRTRLIPFARHRLTSRSTVVFFPGEGQDERELFREANRKADAECDAIDANVASIELEVSELGKRFNNAWIDLFYLELRNIEIEGLASGRCSFVVLQDLIYRVRNWAHELTSINRQSRTLNSGEHCDWMDRERFVGRAVDEIRGRFLLERLTLKEKVFAVTTKPEDPIQWHGPYSRAELKMHLRLPDWNLSRNKNKKEWLRLVKKKWELNPYHPEARQHLKNPDDFPIPS